MNAHVTTLLSIALQQERPTLLVVQIVAAAALLAYFLFRRRRGKGAGGGKDVLEVELTLSGTLNPAEVHFKSGQPARLVIRRYDREPREELFEIEALDIYEILPALHTTIIAFTPTRRGTFPMVLGGARQAGVMVVE